MSNSPLIIFLLLTTIITPSLTTPNIVQSSNLIPKINIPQQPPPLQPLPLSPQNPTSSQEYLSTGPDDITLSPILPDDIPLEQSPKEETSLTSANPSSSSSSVCPFGIYGPHDDSDCICLSSGLWGLAEDYCTSPLALHAVKPNHTFCILNNFRKPILHLEKILTFEDSYPEIAQMSMSLNRVIDRFDSFATSVPLDEDIHYNHSILISHGAPMWHLTTPTNESYCLIHRSSDPTSTWCLFDHLTTTDPTTKLQTFIPIRELSPSSNCTHDESGSPRNLIYSSGCLPLKGNSPCNLSPSLFTTQGPFSDEDVYFFEEETTTTPSRRRVQSSLIARLLNPELNSVELAQLESNLVKRQDEIEVNITTTEDSEDLLEEDEDKISSAKTEIGHKLMRDQIDGYVDTVVAQLTGLGGSLYDPKNKTSDQQEQKQPPGLPNFPILKVLNIIKLIMQKTCSAVKTDYFELALNSFLKIQFESLHAKEPFLPHTTYLRLAYALKLCYNNAKPHIFASDDKLKKKCKGKRVQTTLTTSILDLHGDGSELIHLNATPPHASGLVNSGTREPLIESVWKMLVNAHSYCYPYFKAYFNDHHALTVSLLPLFSNQIQDIWLKEGGYQNTKTQKLYGGLLGDTISVVRDVDNCVAASRFLSQYPWYMSRPLRDTNNIWRRRKRDVSFDDNMQPQPVYIDNGKRLCLYDPDDPVAFLGKEVCE